ncbi:MAG: hypothetical protein HOY79_29005 [Streptomyces sp.]|nr:hypothetical protein [Streptomyces sp.]
MSTNALLIKAAVQAALQQSAGLVDVPILWGPDPRNQPQRLVLLGQIHWDHEKWATNRSKEETFTLDVISEVMLTASTAFDAETQAAELSGIVEDIVKASPGFGLPGIVTSIYSPGRLLSFPADDRWVGQMHAEFKVTART